MTEDGLPLNELLQKAGEGDFLRAVAESDLQLLMEADVEGLIGAGRHERGADRLNWRNGYRDRQRSTRGLAHSKSQDPEAAGRQLLPAVPGGAQDDGRRRWSPSSRKAWIGGVSTRRVERRSHAGDGAFRHLEEPGLETVCKEIPTSA